MPKQSNQKLKLLLIMRFLNQYSDELHPVTLSQIMEELEKHNIAAERKSVYDDIETLRNFGMDITQCRGRGSGYYVANRPFELPELKLLVDSVQSSKFITQKKTMALIRKIENLTSVYDAQLLQRQVYVRGRVKTMNESVYYNVDEISGAISHDHMIRFKYCDYTVSKQRFFRRSGTFYVVSPFALIRDDENYYMLAWDSDAGQLKHFRVDKMAYISAVEQFREGKDAFQQVDMSSYTKKVFGMFTGEEITVRIRFANHLAGAVIDRFGTEVVIVRDGDEHFLMVADVAVSPRFYAWLFGFGDEAEIVYPPKVRQEMAELSARVAKKYI